MHITQNREGLSSAGLALVGAAALGWISRLHGGTLAAAESSLAAPAIVFGVCILLSPALYIGLSLAGAQTSSSLFIRAIACGWRASGLVALGLAPALLFVVATTTSEGLALAFGALAISCSLAVGLVALAKESARHSFMSLVCFVGWAVAAFSVGAHMFARVVLP